MRTYIPHYTASRPFDLMERAIAELRNYAANACSPPHLLHNVLANLAESLGRGISSRSGRIGSTLASLSIPLCRCGFGGLLLLPKDMRALSKNGKRGGHDKKLLPSTRGERATEARLWKKIAIATHRPEKDMRVALVGACVQAEHRRICARRADLDIVRGLLAHGARSAHMNPWQ